MPSFRPVNHCNLPVRRSLRPLGQLLRRVHYFGNGSYGSAVSPGQPGISFFSKSFFRKSLGCRIAYALTTL